MTASARRAALLRLAAIHDLDLAGASAGSVALRRWLEAPETIERWVAVTVASADGTVSLTPGFPDAAAAEKAAERYVEEGMYDQLPLEVVDLDTGQSNGCRLRPEWGAGGDGACPGRDECRG